jgi:hypothetical protein
MCLHEVLSVVLRKHPVFNCEYMEKKFYWQIEEIIKSVRSIEAAH